MRRKKSFVKKPEPKQYPDKSLKNNTSNPTVKIGRGYPAYDNENKANALALAVLAHSRKIRRKNKER